MTEAIHTAMPFILMALAIVLFFAGNINARRAIDDGLSPEERTLQTKKRNERLATSMGAGLAIGALLGLFVLDIPSGAALGAILGTFVGWILNKKKNSTK